MSTRMETAPIVPETKNTNLLEECKSRIPQLLFDATWLHTQISEITKSNVIPF